MNDLAEILMLSFITTTVVQHLALGHSAFCYKFSLLTGMNHSSEPLTLFVLSLPVGIV